MNTHKESPVSQGPNIPKTNQRRIVILGAGFAGLSLAKRLAKKDFQVVLVDRNNFHQFQPLFYQVAMAGLEPSLISFPLRKHFQRKENVFIRIGEVKEVAVQNNRIKVDDLYIEYDELVISLGVQTNYFGNEHLETSTYPLKSVSEAIQLRNAILEDYEKALVEDDFDRRQLLVDIVIVGGGPTGVELAGSLAEMKNNILPKDYVELDSSEVDIHLIQGAPVLLDGMSSEASSKAEKYLKELGVNVRTGIFVKDFDGQQVKLSDGSTISTQKVIWAAGVKANRLPGIPDEAFGHNNRLIVDRRHLVKATNNVYALGDISYMETAKYPKGHPQVAQVAMQQADNLGKNLVSNRSKAFAYKDLGSLATIGRNRAVADLPFIKFQGFFAWVTWLFVHLFQLIGVKNKLFVFLNWVWSYLTYDQSLRLIIKPKSKAPQSESKAAVISQ